MVQGLVQESMSQGSYGLGAASHGRLVGDAADHVGRWQGSLGISYGLTLQMNLKQIKLLLAGPE